MIQDSVTEQISKCKEFLSKFYLQKLTQNQAKGNYRINIDFHLLCRFDPELTDQLMEDPDEFLKEAEIALEQMDFKKFKVRVKGEIPYQNQKVRLRDLRAKYLNKFFTVEGTIETKTDVGIKMTSSVFECPACGNRIPILQSSDMFKEPTKCGCGRKGKFTLVSKNVINVFSLRLQDLATDLKYDTTLTTKSILCTDDLTDIDIEEKLYEGLKVKINGIYREKELFKAGQKQTVMLTYIEANYIKISEETFYDVNLTKDDIVKIKEYAKQDNLIKNIYHSAFSGVLGFDKIKEALILQAFGGVSCYTCTPQLKGDIHILIVGEAGQNKSIFLEFVRKFIPKGTLSVGKTVSVVGLSACSLKDEITGNYVLKPGAIPLSNNGLCEIDEFDKIKQEDRDIILEPMEQQRITVSKANINRSFLARCSFLITMNPKNGYFDPYENIYPQIDLTPPQINRFDLIYVVKKNKLKNQDTKNFEKNKARMMMTRSHDDNQQTLTEYHKFLKLYIAYAKQNIIPKWSYELENDYVPEIYSEFDHNYKEDKGFPVTPRFVFVIKRLSEARARIHLREEVIKEDVDFAINVLRESLKEFAIDSATGEFDADIIQDGVSSSRKNLNQVFFEVFEKLKNNDYLVDEEQLYTELESMGFNTYDIDSVMQARKVNGDIFEPKPGTWRRI